MKVARLRWRAIRATANAVAGRAVGQIREPRLTFGVDDPHGHHLYMLRPSRYDALAHDTNELAQAAARHDKKLSVLHVDCGDGTLLRYLETKPEFGNIIISVTHLRVDRWLYKKDQYHNLFVGDLSNGYPEISSNSYDVVVCEPVFEHLNWIDNAVATVARILKPGGRLIIGVPIFLPPLHLIRKHIVPKLDRIFTAQKSRGHHHAFSQFPLLRKLKQKQNLQLLEVWTYPRSRADCCPPENYHWWWKLDRPIGALVPAACIEIQVVLTKIRADWIGAAVNVKRVYQVMKVHGILPTATGGP
jgi:SAM-dependent methyltransferase